MGEPAGRSIGVHAFHAVHRHLAEQRALPAAKTVERHRNWDGRAAPIAAMPRAYSESAGPCVTIGFQK
jgi:hypothetical protein